MGELVREQGRYRRIAKEANEAHREIATGIQQRQVKNLKEYTQRNRRPQRPTQYLQRAVESKEWIGFAPSGFTVGTNKSLNDNKIKRYWRGIEFGSTKFLGRELQGYWRGIEGHKYPALEARRKADPRLIQMKGGKRRRKKNADGKKRGSLYGPPFPIKIGRPIPESRFMRDGVNAYDADQIKAIYAKWFREYNLRISGA